MKKEKFENIWLGFKKIITWGIKNHKAQCVKILTTSFWVFCFYIVFKVKNVIINSKGISDTGLIWIKEVFNLFLVGLICLVLCSAFNVHPIKKKCRSLVRIRVLGLLAFFELIFSSDYFEECELGRAFLLIICIIIFVQLRRDKKGKNDKDNEYNEVTINLKEFGPPAIELIVAFIVRFAEIVAEILATCIVGSLLKPNIYSYFLFLLTLFLYILIVGQIILNHDFPDSCKQQTITLLSYILADAAAFLASMISINEVLKTHIKFKPGIEYVKGYGYITAIHLSFSFLLVLITWFCYFSYCGWLLKREGKSLDYEFWTLLFKSIVKACIAFALIENELPGTVGLGIEFTICLSIINSLVTTLYPMIDMYKFVRKSLVTTPVKSMEF